MITERQIKIIDWYEKYIKDKNLTFHLEKNNSITLNEIIEAYREMEKSNNVQITGLMPGGPLIDPNVLIAGEDIHNNVMNVCICDGCKDPIPRLKKLAKSLKTTLHFKDKDGIIKPLIELFNKS